MLHLDERTMEAYLQLGEDGAAVDFIEDESR
jgi:hypothetical protein